MLSCAPECTHVPPRDPWASRVDTTPSVFRSPLPPDPPRRGLAHSGRHTAGAWRQVVPRTRAEEGTRLPGVLRVAQSPAVGRRRCQPCETRTLGKDTCGPPPDAPSLPPSGPVGSRWRDYSALAVIMAGVAFGFHQLYKVSPAFLTHPPAFSPVACCPERHLRGGPRCQGAAAEWGHAWRQAAVRSTPRGAGFKSRPGPHPGGCTQQVQPRLIHGARHLPSESCPAGRLRGRRPVSREQHGVFGRLSDMADEHGQWSLAAWVASRPCHSVDV